MIPEHRPVLLHIGYPKTGTSWLQRHFFANPKTGLKWIGKNEPDHPVRRLVGTRPFEFDAATCRASFEPLLTKIETEGLLPVVSFERFTGHPVSGGHDAEVIAIRLAAVFPGAKVLVFVREQRAMIASTYKQYVKSGGACSLRDFLEPVRSESWRVPWFDFGYFEFDHLLRRYRTLFGAESVLALPYERFMQEPADVLAEIGRFAGRTISADLLDSLPYQHPENRSHTAAAIKVWQRVNRLVARSELHQAPLLRSSYLEYWARKAMKRLGRDRRLLGRRSGRQEERLKHEVSEIVGLRYVRSNRATAELLGVDLGKYGWMI